ncbi:hypothetical protein Droror1_Dr00023861 [Drosera rotundifolia]
MVMRFGMSEIGPWAVGDPSLQQSDVFMRTLALNNMSEKLAEDIDTAMRKIVDGAYEIAKTYIENNKEAMDKLVEVLLERNSNKRRIQSNHVLIGRHFFSRIEADSSHVASGAEARIRTNDFLRLNGPFSKDKTIPTGPNAPSLLWAIQCHHQAQSNHTSPAQFSSSLPFKPSLNHRSSLHTNRVTDSPESTRPNTTHFSPSSPLHPPLQIPPCTHPSQLGADSVKPKIITMLKGKIKFPDKIGVLVKGLDGKKEGKEEDGYERSGGGGEELETLQHVGVESVAVDEELGVRLGGKVERESGVRVGLRLGGEFDEKRSDLEYELSQEEINLVKLQRIGCTGIPDGGSLRATTWKLLLGYLPTSRVLWEKVLYENRLKYAELREELLLSPSEIARRKEQDCFSCEVVDVDSSGPLARHDVSIEDHPLSLGEASPWHRFFEYTEIAEQIDRDLQRTHPEMKFFSLDSPMGKKHREAMRNILLIFAKLNPTTRYVQGMNEVLAPLYYVFNLDTDEGNAVNAEADSFGSFVRLLSDSVDHFCQQLDNSSVGIHSTLAKLKGLLKANDEALWGHLEFTSKVNPQFYAFRWITLLLTQEFEFKMILRIWDSLLSHQSGIQDMLLRICCAMLLCVKSRLMSGDFAANVHLLQHYPEVNIEHLLQVARNIKPDPESSPLRSSV